MSAQLATNALETHMKSMQTELTIGYAQGFASALFLADLISREQYEEINIKVKKALQALFKIPDRR